VWDVCATTYHSLIVTKHIFRWVERIWVGESETNNKVLVLAFKSKKVL
jgi:hypothetical protein